MIETPFPYQVAGAEWLASKTQAMLADDMGLGKSAQTIMAADKIKAKNILVVCPASVRINWSREFERFSEVERPVTVLETRKDKVPTSGVCIVSYDLATPLRDYRSGESIRDKLLKVKWDVLIIDEAHYIKDPKAMRTKTLYGRYRFPGLIGCAARVWRLTGTPAPNNAAELWTHFKTMGITDLSYYDFMFRYCSGFDTNYGYKITGVKNADELRYLMKDNVLRRKKEQVLTELPPIRYQEVTVDRSKVDLVDFYEQIHAAGGERAFLDEVQIQDRTLKAALAAAMKDSKTSLDARLGVLESLAPSMVTLRRYIGMAKLPACCDIIAEELESGQLQKIVIFGVHQSVIEGARTRLKKWHPVTLYGGTPPEKRQRNIDRFMNDKACKVFIGNIIAAGTGINLTVASEMAFFEQDWVPANNSQAAMRIHRIGQTRGCRIRIFTLNGSVDEAVQRTLASKSRELLKLF